MIFRLSAIAFSLLLLGGVASAAPCALVKSKPDAWVEAEVNALALAARAAYEKDEALENYKRVVGRIDGTIRQCRLSENESFAGRYREFLGYVEALALVDRPDHELGFTVPD